MGNKPSMKRLMEGPKTKNYIFTYLGDSGSHGTVQNNMMLKINWKDKGKRHETGPVANERP